MLIRRRRFDRGGRHAKREDDVISRPARQAATALRYAASLRVWLHHGDHAQPRQQVHARWRNVGGDEAVRGLARRIPDYSVYGLTAQDLAECQTTYQMEAVANKKRQAWIEEQKAEIARQKATMTAHARKETGAHTFDRGEPTGGASTIPKIRTPEFEQYKKQVEQGLIRLRP